GVSERLPCLLGDGLRRSGADLGRVVANVVIAGQVTARDGQGIVQGPCKFQVVRLRWAVEGDIAAVDDEVGAGRVDIFADLLEIRDEWGQAAGEMGVGNLGQPEFAHAFILPVRSYLEPASNS